MRRLLSWARGVLRRLAQYSVIDETTFGDAGSWTDKHGVTHAIESTYFTTCRWIAVDRDQLPRATTCLWCAAGREAPSSASEISEAFDVLVKRGFTIDEDILSVVGSAARRKP